MADFFTRLAVRAISSASLPSAVAPHGAGPASEIPPDFPLVPEEGSGMPLESEGSGHVGPGERSLRPAPSAPTFFTDDPAEPEGVAAIGEHAEPDYRAPDRSHGRSLGDRSPGDRFASVAGSGERPHVPGAPEDSPRDGSAIDRPAIERAAAASTETGGASDVIDPVRPRTYVGLHEPGIAEPAADAFHSELDHRSAAEDVLDRAAARYDAEDSGAAASDQDAPDRPAFVSPAIVPSVRTGQQAADTTASAQDSAGEPEETRGPVRTFLRRLLSRRAIESRLAVEAPSSSDDADRTVAMDRQPVPGSDPAATVRAAAAVRERTDTGSDALAGIAPRDNPAPHDAEATHGDSSARRDVGVRESAKSGSAADSSPGRLQRVRAMLRMMVRPRPSAQQADAFDSVGHRSDGREAARDASGRRPDHDAREATDRVAAEGIAAESAAASMRASALPARSPERRSVGAARSAPARDARSEQARSDTTERAAASGVGRVLPGTTTAGGEIAAAQHPGPAITSQQAARRRSLIEVADAPHGAPRPLAPESREQRAEYVRALTQAMREVRSLGAQRSRRHAEAREATDAASKSVKISIGRIEVRTQKETPPQQPAARRRPMRGGPEMSLKDYLQQRNRGHQ